MFKKAILKGSIFVIILLIINLSLNSIFIIKTNHREKLIEGLYDTSQQPLDVLLLGSSHMNSGISPNILWNQYGITSFNYATGGQPIDVTYYVLKEALKVHKNPIVVVDLYYLGLTEEYGAEGYVRSALDNLNFSKNKVDAIINCTPRKDWINYLFPIFKYHDRWKELTKNDFEFDPANAYYEKGFAAESDSIGKDNTSDPSTTGMIDLPPKSEEYLNKIINLSKEEGFKLVFTTTPYDYNGTAESTNWTKESAKMFNKIAEISKKNNIPFINYNKITKEMGFDFKTDMFNEGHLNLTGAKKVTLKLGEFLKENYALADHRKDVKYEKWEEDYIRYLYVKANTALTEETDIKNYISLIKNKNYIIVASSNDTGISKNVALKEALTQLGLKVNQMNKDGSNYLAVINENKIQSEILSSSKLSKELVLDKDINLKVTTKSDDKNMPSLLLNKVEYLNKHNGVNIVVFDKLSNEVLDNIYLDSKNKIKREVK